MPRRRATPKSCEGGEAQGGGEAPRAENAAKRNRKPEARDGLKGRGGPKRRFREAERGARTATKWLRKPEARGGLKGRGGPKRRFREAERGARTATKWLRKPEARDGLKGRGGPKMQEILFEILSAAVAACATFIGWILAKRNGHDGEDRDR